MFTIAMDQAGDEPLLGRAFKDKDKVRNALLIGAGILSVVLLSIVIWQATSNASLKKQLKEAHSLDQYRWLTTDIESKMDKSIDPCSGMGLASATSPSDPINRFL